MDPSQFPSNSQVPKQRIFAQPGEGEKEPEKKIEKVVTGKVMTRKKPLGKRFVQTFFGGDGKGVWDYVIRDVVLPNIKDMIADAVSQGVERMIFGDARSSSRRTGQRPGSGGYVNYGKYASKGLREEPRSISRHSRANHDFREIILGTRREAEEVIDQMFACLEKYNMISVSDLYEMVGITPSFVDEKWGWTDLRGAAAQRITNGYLLDLPKPEPLD